MIANDNLLEAFNKIKGKYLQDEVTDYTEAFRKLLNNETNKYYNKKNGEVSYEVLSDLLIGFSLSCMIYDTTETYDTFIFSDYFIYAMNQYRNLKSQMLEKFKILKEKLIDYNINDFIIGRSLSAGKISRLYNNLSILYEIGYKLEDIFSNGRYYFKLDI